MRERSVQDNLPGFWHASWVECVVSDQDQGRKVENWEKLIHLAWKLLSLRYCGYLDGKVTIYSKTQDKHLGRVLVPLYKKFKVM